MKSKKISLDDSYYDRLNLFLKASNAETGRGQALVAASLVEEMLEEILRSYLLPNKQTKNLFEAANAPLSSLSAKSLLCRSLGLISAEEFQDIDAVRQIRNEFAHNVMCSFNDPKISGLAVNLKIGMSILDELPIEDNGRITNPKARFSMVTTSLVTALYNRAYYVKELGHTEIKFTS